jgi:hypothetical protein
VRIIEALYRSAKTGKPIRIPPFEHHKWPRITQRIRRPGVRKPHLIKVRRASK